MHYKKTRYRAKKPNVPKRRKNKLSKDELMAKLKGSRGNIPSEPKKLLDKNNPGVELVQNEMESESVNVVGTNAETTKLEKEGNGEGASDIEKDENTETKDDEYTNGDEKVNTEGKESTANGDENTEQKKSTANGIVDEQNLNSSAKQTIDKLREDNHPLTEKTLEAQRHFQIFMDECKKQYRVITGEERTHATTFKDVYSEWLRRNIRKRAHFGWDPDPPRPPPRKRGRPLNMYAQKRIQKEKDKSAGIVTIAGKKYSARELFERKRLARRNARPPSLAVRIWRFFI